MKSEDFKKILERYSKNEATDKEVVLVEKYLDDLANGPEQPKTNIKEVQDRLYGQIQASINSKEHKRMFRIVHRKWAVAASVLIVIGALFFSLNDFGPKHIQLSTAYGEKREVVLPDGTKVTLNSGSELSYPEDFQDEKRQLTLVGEAFFDVHRDTLRPFIIETGKLKTQVLGTSFNINAFEENDSIRVSVVEGKVMVYDSIQLKEFLLPNQQLKYHTKDGGFHTSQYDSSIDRAWSSNIIHFNSTPFAEAAEMLERWYDITIEIKDDQLNGKVVTGKYIDPELNEAMESLSFLMSVEFIQISPSIYEVTPIKKAPM